MTNKFEKGNNTFELENSFISIKFDLDKLEDSIRTHIIQEDCDNCTDKDNCPIEGNMRVVARTMSYPIGIAIKEVVVYLSKFENLIIKEPTNFSDEERKDMIDSMTGVADIINVLLYPVLDKDVQRVVKETLNEEQLELLIATLDNQNIIKIGG